MKGEVKPRTGKQINTSKLTLSEYVIKKTQDAILSKAQIAETQRRGSTFKEYQEDPVGFVRNVLRLNITDDQATLLESVRDNPITLARSANGVGKTFDAACAITWFYKSFDGAQVYSTCPPPEENLRRILWGEIGRIVSTNPGLFVDDNISLGSMFIGRSDLEFVRGVTIPQSGDAAAKKARFSGKHAPYLLFVIDEGDAVPAEIYEAIDSCMSGGHARLLILFNPRAQMGPIYQMEKSGDANVVPLSAFTHPNVTSGQNLFPGAVTREVTVQRINKWTRPLIPGEIVTSDVFSVPLFLVGEVAKKSNGKDEYPPLPKGLRKPTEPAFSYMVVGEYSPIAEDQLIARDWCERAMMNWRRYVAIYGEVPPPTQPKCGLDVAEMGADTNVFTPRYTNGYVPKPDVWGGIDINDTATRACELHTNVNALGTYVDANGIGAGVWPIMRNAGYTAHRIMASEAATEPVMLDELVLGQFYRMRDQGWWAMREWIRKDPTAMLPEGSDVKGGLIDQLCSAKYGRMPNGRIKICENDVMKIQLGGKSPDEASSLMLTFCPENDESGASEVESHNYDH